MLIRDLANSGAMPTLEAMMRFSGARQRIIAHNIANLTTPDFRPVDVSVQDFRAALSAAIKTRRRQTGGMRGELEIERTAEVQPGPRGELRLTPKTPQGGILFHDRNNRDLESQMQALTENSLMFRVSTELMRSRGEMIRAAIAERA